MTDPLPLIFYTVTNQNYFPGTVATLSSIRTFHPRSPIHVVSERRAPLTGEQVGHLRSLADVHYYPETGIPVGQVREAWQMKAHVAWHLSTQYPGILVQVDSDAILCAPLDDLAAEAARRGVPVGGKDGRGANYSYRDFSPYHALCGVAPGEQDHFNPHYTSASVLLLPTEPLAEIFPLWSIGVDKGIFGPKERPEKLYAGCGDQGVLNAILYFKGITPQTIDGEILSEHWTHGRNPVTFQDGCFWNGSKQQRAFHSVGYSPKFWTAAYREYVRRKTNLEPVYLYWLFHLFDGPCGLLGPHIVDRLERNHKAFFPESAPDLLGEYLQRRQPVLRRVMQDYGRLALGEPALPWHEKRTSPNLLCIPVFNGYFDRRADIHYFYSAVKRLQRYRALGGTADVVIFADGTALSDFLNPTLVALMQRNRIRLVQSSGGDLRRLFLDRGIDIEALQSGSIAGLEEGRRAGRYAPELNARYNVIEALELYLGRYLLANELTQRMGYERCAMVDADGGRYAFEEGDIPPEGQVDDLWRFDEFTDFVYQETVTGKTEMHKVTAKGLRELFELRREDDFLPMFQTNAHWVQGTRAAFDCFIGHYTREILRQYGLGYYPGDEQVTTAIFLRGCFWPAHGAMVGQSLKRQIEVTRGAAFPWPQPFYLRRGEDKYIRHFQAPPALEGRYAVSICGFNGEESRHYSEAALERARAYREVLHGKMDVHIYTNDLKLSSSPQIHIHGCTAGELATAWDARATFANLMEIHHEALTDVRRHKDGRFIKRPELAQGMISKIMAIERTLAMGYDGVLSADADGDQFSVETIGALGRRHIDSIWCALRHHPLLCYIVGTAAQDSFQTWLSVLCEISGLPGHNEGPFDWMWGPCWMIEANFARRFFQHARTTLCTILDRRIAFHDEHLLNCTYNLPEFDDDLLRGIRDLGDAARIGYRELNPAGLLRYQRWSTRARHRGRVYRGQVPYHEPEFQYRS